MRDFMLVDGDLQLGEDLATVSDREELAQSCRLLVGTSRGEWWLNPLLGLEVNAVLGKATDDEIRDALMDALLQEPRIQTVDAVTIDRDRMTRKIKLSFSATGEEGGITAEVEQDAG